MTLRAIKSLKAQDGGQHIEFDTFLVDDGSTDGTSLRVSEEHPEVRIIRGDGSLFWTGGTNGAWHNASIASAYDGFLWLNDDVELFGSAVHELQETIADQQAIATGGFILVGSTVDRDAGSITYGGFDLVPYLRVLRRLKRRFPICGTRQYCMTMNGNFVFVSYGAFEKLGFLDEIFDHSMADIDYGLRATAAGVPIRLLSNPIGICQRNKPSDAQSVLSSYLSRFDVRNFPLKQWFLFTRRHYGPFFLVSFLLPYIPRPSRLRRKAFR